MLYGISRVVKMIPFEFLFSEKGTLVSVKIFLIEVSVSIELKHKYICLCLYLLSSICNEDKLYKNDGKASHL